MKNRMNATKLIKHKYKIQIINKQLPLWKYATKDGATTMNPYLTQTTRNCSRKRSKIRLVKCYI